MMAIVYIIRNTSFKGKRHQKITCNAHSSYLANHHFLFKSAVIKYIYSSQTFGFNKDLVQRLGQK